MARLQMCLGLPSLRKVQSTLTQLPPPPHQPPSDGFLDRGGQGLNGAARLCVVLPTQKPFP